jgi:hypothetical protein
LALNVIAAATFLAASSSPARRRVLTSERRINKPANMRAANGHAVREN